MSWISRSIVIRFFAVAGLALVMLGGSGCTTGQTGQYAAAKQKWDSPRSDQVEDALRNRLAHTQHDH